MLRKHKAGGVQVEITVILFLTIKVFKKTGWCFAFQARVNLHNLPPHRVRVSLQFVGDRRYEYLFLVVVAQAQKSGSG